MPEKLAGEAGGAAAWIGYVVAVATVLFAWLRDKRKGDIDESALVLGKWKELVEQHEKALKSFQDEFASFKQTALAEKAALVADLSDVRSRLRSAESRISELEAENAGLKRTIAQNSQSTAYQLSRRTPDDLPGEIDDATARLDRAGHNLKEGME